MKIVRFVIATVLLASAALPLLAQTNGASTAVGFSARGSFQGSDIETVDVTNGNLHVHIPLWAIPGRGVTNTAAFVYDSKGWGPNIICYSYSCIYTVGMEDGNTMKMAINGGSLYGKTHQTSIRQICDSAPPYYTITSGWFLRDPEGTKHHMVPDPLAAVPQTCWPLDTMTRYADDGSGWNSNGVSKSGGVPGEYDSNGNSLTLYNGTQVDTMGRPYDTTNGSYYDSNGVLRNISVTTQSVAISTHLCFPNGTNGDTCSEYSDTWTVPHIITLPNGLKYTINYVQNDEGQISSIVLPTGAIISYEYSSAPTYDFAGKQVTKRTVTAGSQVSVWQYAYTAGYPDSVTTETDPLQNQVKYTCSAYSSMYTSEPTTDFPCVITKEQYYDNSANLIKTITIGFNQGSTGAMQPTSRTVTWAGTNQVSKVETDYETMSINMFPDGSAGPVSAPITWGNVSEKREYDWGTGTPGALLRRTTYTYLHTDTSVNPNANRVLYLAANIADRPTSEIVKDGGGNVIAQAKYYYDEGTLTPTNNAIGHDYANFGASNKIRGNLSRVSRWMNSTGAWLDTAYTYDDLGNRLTEKDPNGHTTYYDYTDSFSGSSCNITPSPTYALPTKVTNDKGFRVQTTYYQCTSLPQNIKDENDIQYGHPGGTFTYDLMNRRLTTARSDGGTISTTYQDSVPLQATTVTAITGSAVPAGVTANLSHTTVVVSDGLGRVSQTQSNNPEGGEYVDTTYDLLGRVSTVSNPHHSSSNPTLDGVTTYGYDALGRTISVTHPDNSVLTTQYSGTAVSVTDEGNGNGIQKVQRINDYDGLGRLKSVCEVSGSTLSGSSGNVPASCGQAISATGFLTTYQYTSDSSGYSYSTATAAGLQTRSFVYDSLGRLKSAFNPEAGTTTYIYDNDGLLYQRQRPTANQTGSAVTTTTYAYDNIHRLLSVSYDDGTTPSLSYCYDETSLWGRTLANSLGRRTRSHVGATCSGTPIAAEIYGYDAMGRVVVNDQCTPGQCGSSQKYFDYGYDYLSGELTATNGVGVTYTSNLDGAGRLLTATSSLQDANHPATLFSNAAYGVFGLTSANIGPSMTETISQQNRGWIQSIQAANLSFNGYATGKIIVSGTEQSRQQQTQSATQSSASITLSGSGRQKKVYDSDCNCFDWVTDAGNVYVTVNGFLGNGSYSSASDTSGTVAASLAASLNRSGSPVTASASGTTVTLTSKASGAAVNYSLTYSTDYDNTDWSTPAFTFTSAPSAMSGGHDAAYTTVFDQGAATVTVNGHATTTSQWGSGSTSTAVAQSIATAINGDSGAYVTASASNGIVTLTAKITGTGGQYAFSASTAPGSGFSSPSFSASASGTNLSYGAYTVTVGHALNGDVTSAQDTVNGNWTYTYDEFNRLTAASNATTSLSWNYDRFGNRWNQNVLAGTAAATSNSFGTDNRASGYAYDSAGNVLNDGLNQYTYDAEGRITCVVSVAGGGSCTSTTGTHYGYNADGLRVARYSGTTLTNQYLYNTQGQMVTELDGGGGWQRGEVYVRGMYVATYENGTTTFTHTDWLGTVRYRSNLDGSVGETCTNLPFGDSLTCAGRDSSHKHFTGKLRDDDTGLDYFGARYYAGLQGRFLTPDWSASPAAVPYGDFANPQSLNLYAYVDNNPATGVDPDGHLVEINYDGVPGSASQDGAYGGDPSFFKAYVGDEWQRIMAKCMLDRDQQQQAQKAAQKQNGQQEKWNHNIVLKGQAGDAAGASHVILWVPYTLKDGKLDKPLVDAAHPENSSDPSVQVSLKESIKGGPFVNKGTSSGHGCDSLTCMGSGFTSPVNQHWYVNGERVQLVMGSDPATGKPHLTWEVHVTREVEGPRYFPVGQGDQ